MLTRLEIDGFKSLRQFAVDLEPVTVFIGPNSAGKSNILDALALLSRLSSMPIEDAFKQRDAAMIYIRAGVYAEGPTDYDFLLPLLDRMLDTHAARLFEGQYELASTTGIDAPRGIRGPRADRIVAAIGDWWDSCTLFVIHSDGAGDPVGVRQHCIEPGLRAARAAWPDRAIAAVGCVPVREGPKVDRTASPVRA